MNKKSSILSKNNEKLEITVNKSYLEKANGDLLIKLMIHQFYDSTWRYPVDDNKTDSYVRIIVKHVADLVIFWSLHTEIEM